MKLRIVAGGSAANPPTLAHRALLKTLLDMGRFDVVLWIPSGSRPGKEGFVAPDHRVAMTLLTIPPEWLVRLRPRLSLSFMDVYGQNTPTWKWLERLHAEYPGAEITWVTGSDSVTPISECDGRCEIEMRWEKGRQLMRRKFLIVPRPGFPLPDKLPPSFHVLDCDPLALHAIPEDCSSSQVRERVREKKPITGLVTLEVAAYIRLHELYQPSA